MRFSLWTIFENFENSTKEHKVRITLKVPTYLSIIGTYKPKGKEQKHDHQFATLPKDQLI